MLIAIIALLVAVGGALLAYWRFRRAWLRCAGCGGQLPSDYPLPLCTACQVRKIAQQAAPPPMRQVVHGRLARVAWSDDGVAWRTIAGSSTPDADRLLRKFDDEAATE